MYLSLRDVAEMLGVDYSTVRHWVHNYADAESGEDVSGPCLPARRATGSSIAFVEEADLAVFRGTYWDEVERVIERRRETLLS